MIESRVDSFLENSYKDSRILIQGFKKLDVNFQGYLDLSFVVVSLYFFSKSPHFDGSGVDRILRG